jgi:hypothetical protein
MLNPQFCASCTTSARSSWRCSWPPRRPSATGNPTPVHAPGKAAEHAHLPLQDPAALVLRGEAGSRPWTPERHQFAVSAGRRRRPARPREPAGGAGGRLQRWTRARGGPIREGCLPPTPPCPPPRAPQRPPRPRSQGPKAQRDPPTNAREIQRHAGSMPRSGPARTRRSTGSGYEDAGAMAGIEGPLGGRVRRDENPTTRTRPVSTCPAPSATTSLRASPTRSASPPSATPWKEQGTCR